MVDEARPVGGIYLKVGFDRAGEVMGVYPGETSNTSKTGQNYPPFLHHKAYHVVKGQITRGELPTPRFLLLVESFCATVLTEPTNQTLEESGQRRLSFAQMKFFKNVVACGAHRFMTRDTQIIELKLGGIGIDSWPSSVRNMYLKKNRDALQRRNEAREK
jgi:hypothetical protein